MKSIGGSMGLFCRFFCVFLLKLNLIIFAHESSSLELSDINTTMKEMLKYHVEYSEFNEVLAKRSLRVYIEQFDPEKIYFQKDEVDQYFNLTIQAVGDLVSEFQHGRFDRYILLNENVRSIILKAQILRSIAKKQIIENFDRLSFPNTFYDYEDYSENSETLYDRIYQHLLCLVSAYLQDAQENAINKELVEKILVYAESKFRIRENTYLSNSIHSFAQHTLVALAKCLDAHTNYFSPEEAYDFRTMLKKEFCGVGLVFGENFKGIFVKDVKKGGPAQLSGRIECGDKLISINGHSIDGLSFSHILQTLKGKKGSKVVLGLQRGNNVFECELIRVKISMDDDRITYFSKPCEGGIAGIINVPSFYDNGGNINTASDLRRAFMSLKSQGDLKGLVLDFRENYGGFLNQAVKVASLFIDDGLIVVSKYAQDEVSYERDVFGTRIFDGPVVILISKASASAAEVVAQAMQDHGVAVIAGDRRSYGKGTMQFQTLTEEKAAAFFKVTVGKYYTASGRSPQIKGVHGDIYVPTKYSALSIGEKYLDYPLNNDCLNADLFYYLSGTKHRPFHNHSNINVPYLKPKKSKWRLMIPKLKESSMQRISSNEQYKHFLSTSYSLDHRIATEKTFGDFQIQECSQIISDMVNLSR